MAGEGGETVHPLIRALEQEPGLFSFFQAVRLLEQAQPEAAPVGGLGPPAREAVRLRPSSSLAFPAASVTECSPRPAGGPRHLLTTTVLGLYGASGPLPAFYSEEILQREIGDEDPVRLFLDLLNHRLLSLLYRAWAKYRWAFCFEAGARDPISGHVLGLLGLGSEALRATVDLPPARLLRYAGVVTQRPRSAASIAGALTDWFAGVPVRIEQCVLRWVALDRGQRSRLGRANVTLGEDALLGERVRDRAGKCRVVLGPLDLEGYLAFLPSGPHSSPLGALLRLLLPDPLDAEVRLVLAAASVPGLRLSAGPAAARLGWTSWLLRDPAPRDKAELFPLPV
jgi:type VI secretion system protein ImpH